MGDCIIYMHYAGQAAAALMRGGGKRLWGRWQQLQKSKVKSQKFGSSEPQKKMRRGPLNRGCVCGINSRCDSCCVSHVKLSFAKCSEPQNGFKRWK